MSNFVGWDFERDKEKEKLENSDVKFVCMRGWFYWVLLVLFEVCFLIML